MKSNRGSKRAACVLGVILVARLWGPATAQQASPEEPIFRLVTFQAVGDLRLGATEGDGQADIVDIHNAIRALTAAGEPQSHTIGYIPADMRSLIEVGDGAIAGVKTVYRAARKLKASGAWVDPGGERRVFYPATAVRLRTPIPNPEKIFGVAGNYHPAEPSQRPADQAPSAARAPSGSVASPQEPGAGRLGRTPDRTLPSTFLKSVSALVGPDDEIVLTDMLTDGFPNTHEAELAVVIGKRAKNVSEAEAMNYVLGYTVHNDVSGRTLRTGASSSEGSSMTKGMDTFAPTGPYPTLKEDVPDPHNLAIETKLNGKVFPMPNAHTKYMRHKIPAIVSLLSKVMTLQPGDIIATGVPAPTAPLKVGDVVEITIERLGTLRNRIVRKGSTSSD
jgi:2-keto-4-pentenoate hydratase/2-oxohepta-3-ene-1,7-dioic acid hydratase in catechol pathway